MVSTGVSITGLGATALAVSGSGASRIFVVGAGATMSISRLTLANGLADQGGAVDNLGSLTLSQCVLSNNEALGDSPATGNGGAIFNELGATLNVTQCSFVSNQALGSPGVGLGGALLNEGTATMTGSIFYANIATGGHAGGGEGGAIASH